jgi:ABC-type nitrate/sulfonate/bicarbonate transport system substrate-binding protein
MKSKICIAMTLLLFAGCSQSSQKRDTKKFQASLRFGWFTSLSFSGEVTGMKEFESKYNLDLTCEPGSETTDPIKLVLAGNNTFGVIAADKILAANEKGADLVIIGCVDYPLPGAFVSKKEKNILQPKDWEGKRIGVLPGGSTDYLYRVFLKKTGIDASKITEVPIPFDLKPFLNDQIDVQPVFVFDETVTLDQRGIGYNLIEPKNFGIIFPGRCYFCKRSIVEQQPEMVQAFINTMADGWNDAIKNPQKAIKNLKEFAPEIDEKRELLSLMKGIPYFRGYKDKPLTSNIIDWQTMLQDLKDLGALKSVELNKSLNFAFVDSYYINKQ